MTQAANEQTPRTDGPPGHRYTAALAGEIETRWQGWWDERGTFVQPNPGQAGFDASKPKFYCLDMFPYPSGAGLHVGHPEGYTATDIVCRYKRMKGFNVLHPMGWDAFGLPAEQYAVQTGVHPAETTRKSIDTFRRQLKRFGFSYDWSREFGTIDEGYYKWTQWIFLRIYSAWFDAGAQRGRPIEELIGEFESGVREVRVNPAAAEHDAGVKARRWASWAAMGEGDRRLVLDSYRLAYLGEQTVNWCPKLGTALANEEVIDGRSERGGFPVFRKPLRQWMLRITAYAERLLRGLEGLDWPESTRTQQAEWIGRSEGAEIEFELAVLGTPPLRGGSVPSGSPGVQGTHIGTLLGLFEERGFQALRPIDFVPRDPYPEGQIGAVADLIDSRRRLPHLRLDKATYFVTWKCSEGVELDADARSLVLDALRHFDGERCRVYAAVVMSNHVHWIVRPYEGVPLDDLVTSVKRFSAKGVNEHAGSQGHIWMPEQFDHIIRDTGYFTKFVQYVVMNPVEAGVVSSSEQYPWLFVHIEAVGEGTAAEWRGTPDLGAATGWRGTQGPGTAPEGRGTQGRSLRVYTTRPDTIFGATYMVVAPEHPLVAAVLASPPAGADAGAIAAYADRARNRSDVDRQEGKEKTGVPLGVSVVNPATGERIPVWAADYVLMGYGTGAIMAVPAGDERDYEFAKAFDLPIVDVVYPRPILAMAYAAEHLSEEEGEGDWIGMVADFVGMVMSEDANPERFASLLGIVRTRRRTMAPDAEGARGGVQAGWRLAIEDMGEAHFAGFRSRFANGRHWAQHGSAYAGAGRAVRSANSEVDLNGLTVGEAKERAIAWLEATGQGQRTVNYRLRDWLFSRQRYWGEPFPIVFDEQGHHHPVGEAALPVTLPPMADYQPIESQDPKPLLAKATDWLHTTAGEAGVPGLPPGAPVTREANTMPGWAGSCWYEIRYCDPWNDERFVGREAERYWMGGGTALRAVPGQVGDLSHLKGGVDLYIGGSEHAVLHLLYARFWHKVLFDLGEVSSDEPFAKLFHQGLITSFAFQRKDKSLVAVDAVENRGTEEKPAWVETATGEPVVQATAKMSKSLKNVVNPDEVIEQYGADTFRLYEMYMGPLEASKPWNTKDTIGLFRFCQRLWRLCIDEESGRPVYAGQADPGVEKRLHRMIDKVGRDVERLGFNTAIAAMIEFVNAADVLTEDQMDRFARAVAPFVPHIGEELWHRMGREGSVAKQPWPEVDGAMLIDSEVEVPVQVLGKVRSKITVPAGADEKAMEAAALADPRIAELLVGKTVRKVIVVPGRLVNIVAS